MRGIIIFMMFFISVQGKIINAQETSTGVLFANNESIGGVDLNGRLLQASESGNFELIEKLLQSGADVNIVNDRGWTPLITAINSNQTKTALLLLLNGADVNQATNDGCVPLSFAAGKEELQVLSELLKSNADPNIYALDGGVPLTFAVKTGFIQGAKLLIKYGADINHRSSDNGTTPLFIAIHAGRPEMVLFLINNGASIHHPLPSGSTPLMIAAQKTNSEIVRSLIANGANVNAEGILGHTALIYASVNGRVGNIKLLLENGADIFAMARSHNSGVTCDAISATRENIIRDQKRYEEALQILEEYRRQQLNNVVSAAVNKRDKSGCTPLHWAAMISEKDIALNLLKKGADVNARNGKRADNEEMYATNVNLHYATPLHMAVRKVLSTDMIELLLNNGADVHAVDDKGRTPLHYAWSGSNWQGSRTKKNFLLLLNHGAELLAKDASGKTAIDLGLDFGFRKQLEELSKEIDIKFFRKPNIAELLEAFGDCSMGDKRSDCPPAIEILRANPDLIYETGKRTAMHYAVFYNLSGIIDFMMEMGADINIRNEFGGTPIFSINHVDTITQILTYGVDVNAINMSGQTVLHKLARYDHRKGLIKILIENGAKADIVDNLNMTPYDVAVVNKNEEIQMLLPKVHPPQESPKLPEISK